jgi:hypothetical protein
MVLEVRYSVLVREYNRPFLLSTCRQWVKATTSTYGKVVKSQVPNSSYKDSLAPGKSRYDVPSLDSRVMQILSHELCKRLL